MLHCNVVAFSVELSELFDQLGAFWVSVMSYVCLGVVSRQDLKVLGFPASSMMNAFCAI